MTTDTQTMAPSTATTSSAPAIFTTREAASYLGLAMTTLNKWRCHGGGPKFLKLGRAVRYRKEELDHFVETRMFGSTAEI